MVNGFGRYWVLCMHRLLRTHKVENSARFQEKQFLM